MSPVSPWERVLHQLHLLVPSIRLFTLSEPSGFSKKLSTSRTKERRDLLLIQIWGFASFPGIILKKIILQVFKIYLIFFFFLPYPEVYEIIIPQPGIETIPLALEGRVLIIGGVPGLIF